MSGISFFDIVPYLLLAARWTLLLSAIAFIGGGVGATLLLFWRYGHPKSGKPFMTYFVQLVQGTPLLLQLFLVFFGLPLVGVDISPMLAATLAFTLYATAFLAEIWRGCVDAIPRGQWDASASLGMTFISQMAYVILPQSLKIAIPPTVGFLVQLLKSTALASIVGFEELLRAGQIISNATFQPLITFGMVAIIYFVMCYPLTLGSRILERRLSAQK